LVVWAVKCPRFVMPPPKKKKRKEKASVILLQSQHLIGKKNKSNYHT